MGVGELPGPVRVKICGISRPDDAAAAVEAGAAALGFNFYRASPRYVDPAVAAAIVATLPATVCAVGVFVNADRDTVRAIAERVALQALQFHGDEPPAFCRGWDRKVIKALRVADAAGVRAAEAYDVDLVLVDAYVEGQFGGTGRLVRPEWLAGFDRDRLILAGGLTPANVAAAVRAIRPFAVDVASGVESAPGRKDAERMRRFVENVRAA